MQDTLRCAVIGSGFAGSTFAEAIRYVPEAQLVVIAGGHQAANLAERHGVPALPTAEVDRVLESDEIDAVIGMIGQRIRLGPVIRRKSPKQPKLQGVEYRCGAQGRA